MILMHKQKLLPKLFYSTIPGQILDVQVRPTDDICQTTMSNYSLVRYVIFSPPFIILIKKGGLLQLKVGVGVNIYLWAR